MRRTARILLVFLALPAFRPAFAEPPEADPNRARIERLGKEFADAYNRGDFPALARMYAEDAIVFPPESNPLKGRAEIETFWRGGPSLGIRSIQFDVLDVESSGNFIVETGRANMNVQGAGPAQAVVSVKYVVVWKKQKDGSWKLYRDIWNSLPPAPPPAAMGTPAATATPAPHH